VRFFFTENVNPILENPFLLFEAYYYDNNQNAMKKCRSTLICTKENDARPSKYAQGVLKAPMTTFIRPDTGHAALIPNSIRSDNQGTGKSPFSSVLDGLLPITCTGSAGSFEHNPLLQSLVKFTNKQFAFQALHYVPPSFRYPAQRSVSVAQKIINFYFRYVPDNSYWANLEFNKQKPVHLSLNGIELINGLNDVNDHNNYLKTRFSLLMTIHPNPGPRSGSACDRDSLELITYNVNGLGDENKVKRLINKLIKYNERRAPAIIALQETHLTHKSTRLFNNRWRFQGVHSCHTSASAGVSILYFSHQWAEVVAEESDLDGRICSVTLRSHLDEKFTFVSVYVPSSNRESLAFIDSVEAFCSELLRVNPDSKLILLGDFNYTTDHCDYITRTVTPIETILRLKMEMLTQTFDLKDSYRQIHPKGGFTWGHKNTSASRSRIDRIFTPADLVILDAEVITDFDQSDHSLLVTKLKVSTNKPRGPGCYKINPGILDNDNVRAEIEKKISTHIDRVPSHFDPHVKWDYIKLGIRNIFMEACSNESKSNKFELKCAESELNFLHNKLENLLTSGADETDPTVMITKLEIKRCETAVNRQREIESKNLIYMSRAKWSEEGEKSTKYFLNLIKTKTADSTINSVKTANGDVSEQKLIEEEIYNYYSQLYSKKSVSTDDLLDEAFLFNNPKISEQQKALMNEPITLRDLYKSVQSCDDSAPGPDAIPYSIYKKFWHLLGPLLLKSWEHSVRTGKMSQEQRQSIITLIPKKDKDKTVLSNLRPISLTNTDVKIITKAITLKLNPILNSIISPTQTAYVTKRQVSDNTFLLDKIIQLANKTEENLFILSLDAQKAFDSVDHEYMYRTLKSFGFGDEFIATIRTIYNDLTASVMVNGFKTKVLALLRGVKQGDALSCALFIICVEPLFRAIQNSQYINGFKVRSPYTLESTECKLAGYADDFTPIVADIESVREVFRIYHSFSLISGVYLNPDKTEILTIGPQYGLPPTEILVEYGDKRHLITTTKRVTVCGVSHPMNIPESYKHNITDKIAKLKQVLNSWRCRSLSIIGKILITKTYGLSQLIYFLQTCHINESDLKLIESTLFSFIWSAKSTRPNDKIKRSTLKCSIDNGGLNAPDIFSLNKSLKFKKWLRTLHNNRHPVSIVQDRFLFGEGVKDKFPQEIHKSIIKNVSCPFYQSALDTNNILSNINYNQLYQSHSRDEVDCEQLSFIAAHPIASSPYLINNLNRPQILRRLSMLGLTNLGALVIFHKENPHALAWLEVAQCLRAFPRLWTTLLKEHNDWKLNSYTNETIFVGDSKWIHNALVTTKQLRILIHKQHEQPIHKLDLAIKHGLDLDELDSTPDNPFKVKISNSAYLQTLHYRTLHKAYTTRAKLFLYGKIDSPICPFCGDRDDDFDHALYKCDLSRHTWRNFQSWIDGCDIPVHIAISNIVLGVNENTPFSPLLNTIIVLIKRILLSPSETRRALSRVEIENAVKDQILVEKMQLTFANKRNKRNKLYRFHKRWGHLLHLIE